MRPGAAATLLWGGVNHMATTVNAGPRLDRLPISSFHKRIFFLIGARSRVAVAWSWFWTFISGQHSARLITQGRNAPQEDRSR